ncbi:KamA family radical SAM protein [Streptomyces lutosisoli]|uniref:KamA family radical SAM protein n=1 Tax=Streptomyces lutosisoli TaxID=2665721 RepID=A0ABW2VQP0_9ACTN
MARDHQPPAAIRDLARVEGLPPEEALSRADVVREFEFRITPYYAALIDWSDLRDPLRLIVMPEVEELSDTLDFDPSDEASNTRVRGLQHKYPPTALLLLTDVCATYCRFCFRKRFTLGTDPAHHLRPEGDLDTAERETTLDIGEGLRYIRAHPEIDNVLLTGGDPLMLSPARLTTALTAVRAVPHVGVIRIGSKVPAFDPARITPALAHTLASASRPDARTHVMCHFTHSRELTSEALAATTRLQDAGIILTNQSPLLCGVNDDPDELAQLHRRLAATGIAPYYVFLCRPTRGNERFALPLAEAVDIITAARAQLNGLAKRFRFVASHTTGKIEILGRHGDELLFRYHEARNPADQDRLLSWPAGRPVTWLDEVVAAAGANPVPAMPHPQPHQSIVG